MDASQAQLQELKAITVRLPEILHGRILGEVNKRRAAGERKLSMADWMIETARMKLDGPPASSPIEVHFQDKRTLVPDDDYAQHKRSAAEIAASIPGVRKGL